MLHDDESEMHPTADQGIADEFSDALGDRQLIVVSNRQPYRHDYEGEERERPTVDRPTGGLTAGLDPIMQEIGGLWIAWGDGDADFDVVDSKQCVAVPPDDPGYQLKRLWLSDEQVRDYYYGYSNQVLWPICHSALTNVNCDVGFWRQFRQVNEQFAAAVADHAEENSLVWFHDYHLALAPKFARPHLPEDTTVMQFWHIPWPTWDTFRACPHGRELLEGLLDNDVLGFHVARYGANFLSCVDAGVDDAVVDWQAGEVSHEGRTTTVEAIPIGVPFDRIQQSATSTTADAFWTSFRQSHNIDADMQVAMGVDRLDYTKGIVARLRALEQFWASRPEWRGELTYVQNASESRSRIPAYEEVQESVEATISRINDRFETDDWTPIVYTTKRLSQDELCGLYRNADMAIVSPIRDGMNLVAQEYVAAQTDGDGVLVLSDQAGIHDEIGEYAVTVSPFDTEGFTASIDTALSMPTLERRRRMDMLRRWVSTHDLETWFVENVRAATDTASVDTRSVKPP